MPLDNAALLDGLDSVITIPIVPFKDGRVDYEGHARNAEYLMQQNALAPGRPRVISVAGTSLIHHFDPEDQVRIVEETGKVMGGEGVLIASVVPNPIGTAEKIVEAQSRLPRPPDAYLIMPLVGVCNPDGIYDTFLRFGETCGKEFGARFLYYHRSERDRDAVIRLLRDSPHFVGVKIGTHEDDVRPFVDGVGGKAMVIWGIGDRATAAAELGAKGHTSGIGLVCARLSDEINNAHRREDYAAARVLEALISPLEDIRFRDGRMYNYAAVVEAIRVAGFDDVVGGADAPFNATVPPDIAQEVRAAVEPLRPYH